MNSKSNIQVRGKKSVRREVLVPLSGKARLDKDDVEILQADREALELMAEAILGNKRLVNLIVAAYLRENDYVMAPKDWMAGKTAVV